MRFSKHLLFFLVLVFSVLQLGSQSAQAVVTITGIPTWGQDGSITGTISGTGAQPTALYLFAFVPDEGWYGIPSSCSPVSVTNGQFSVTATPTIIFRSATRFTAYVEPATLSPQCNTGAGTIPFEFDHDALSSATIPRIPEYSTISFGGLNWYLKDAPVEVYPGPQFFVGNNAFVDSAGQLHLQINNCSGSWCAAEVYTQQTVGYGTYQFAVNSGLSNLDPNVTLGLFTWDGQAGGQNNREWDIEFGQVASGSSCATGRAAGPSCNAQYVVQPYNGPDNIQHFLMSPAAPSVHLVAWSPSQVNFLSSGPANNPIAEWSFPASTSAVPTPGDVHLHLNFYVSSGQGPSVSTPQEIVISAFQYTPAPSQIGFARTADNLPFQAQTPSVILNSTPSTCAATAESDSPWLTITGSNVIPAGGTLQYSVPINIGNSRSGNLLLQSTNCDVTLGAQILAVTQAGLICAPTFASPSTSIGFLQSVFSVFIQGTASPCTWTVSSSSPWLTVLPPASGGGNGSVTVTANANSDANLRNGVLSLSSGPAFTVRQDGSGSLFALSPQSVASCGSQSAQFGLSWVAPGNVEIHLGTATGTSLGVFGPTGTTILSATDGTVIYLVQSPVASPPGVLATAQTSVLSSSCNVAGIAPLGIVNAASFASSSLAPGSLATIFGGNLSQGIAQAGNGTYPTSLGGVSVLLGGISCPLWYVSPTQINFAVPVGLVPGRYTLSTGSAMSDVLITNVAPGIFTLSGSGSGVPLAGITGVFPDGTTVSLQPYQCTSGGCAATPINLPGTLTDLYIVLYGTGIRNYKNISASLGSNQVQVAYAGAQGQYPGLDQINLHLTAPFSFTSVQSLLVQVDGFTSNTVTLLFQ